ncbi:hypothetical protein FRC10_008607 [Ceratobasidium sp. 414]|nr:hypothetical protein FRC10_008607 [Ceratobasidium sp. 414]
MARQIVQSRGDGGLPLMNDRSTADPASNGVGVLIANWTGASLWSDFIYMVPPFLAYYGMINNNQTLLGAYSQIKLYWSALIDGTGMWQHIKTGSFEDVGHWSTGNGWVARGMLRVLATIQGSQWANPLKGQTRDLENWVIEILDAMWPHLVRISDYLINFFTNNTFEIYDQNLDGLFYNYAGGPSTFPDAASTALLAASTYHLSLVSGVHTHLPSAEHVRGIISTQHLDSSGWLNPVVVPNSFHDPGQQSPEAEAFVLQMHAAWEDWVEDGSKGANAAGRKEVGWWWVVAGVVRVVVLVV